MIRSFVQSIISRILKRNQKVIQSIFLLLYIMQYVRSYIGTHNKLYIKQIDIDTPHHVLLFFSYIYIISAYIFRQFLQPKRYTIYFVHIYVYRIKHENNKSLIAITFGLLYTTTMMIHKILYLCIPIYICCVVVYRLPSKFIHCYPYLSLYYFI